MNKTRISLLRKQADLEVKYCESCDRQALAGINPEVACRNCSIYEELRSIGQSLIEETHSRSKKLRSKKVGGKAAPKKEQASMPRLFTEEEDATIIARIKEYGEVHGIMTSIGRELNRRGFSIKTRVDLLKKKGLL